MKAVTWYNVIHYLFRLKPWRSQVKKIIGVDNSDKNYLDSVIISLLFQLHEYSWLFIFNLDAWNNFRGG